MNKKKKIDRRKYLFVFVMTAIIFMFGLLVGSMTSTQKLTDVRELQDSLRSDTLDLEILNSVLEQDPCAYVNTTPLTDKLYDVAIRLDYMEGLLGKDDDNVLRLKKYYSLLELRQWLFEQRVKEECSFERHFILFFYSNDDNCPRCEEQGFILSYLRKKYGDSLSVYSFDVNVESEAVTSLRARYKLGELPTLVVDEHVLYGYHETAAIEDFLVEPQEEPIAEVPSTT